MNPHIEFEVNMTIDGYRLPPARVSAPQVFCVALEALEGTHKVERARLELLNVQLQRDVDRLRAAATGEADRLAAGQRKWWRFGR